ncbi:MAG: tRNA isopentenyl-2-thiomethyl-A-37 hydroxylase MiaE, partial [Planctomycetota bacterium]
VLPAGASAPPAYVTPAAWAAAQASHRAELLVEQAHLEKKAAAAAMQFLFRVPAPADALRGLSALAREELAHFERTLKLLERRRIAFGPQAPSPYAEQLKRGCARTMPERLVDELLVAAVIEARSHERMALLAAACRRDDAELARFYDDLVDAEARHAPLYVELAVAVVGPDVAAARRAALAVHEAAVLRQLPFAPRLHSGWPADHG